MSNIRGRNTSPEMMVRRIVHGMGFRYRLHVRELPGKPDLVLPRLKKIIEVYGCFWHQHEGCIDSHIPKSRVDYWRPKLVKNVERGKLNQAKLAAIGWEILTVWECELRDLEQTRKRIRSFLQSVARATA
jgi:DNA mismatch endonuclease (patch repair protein)